MDGFINVIRKDPKVRITIIDRYNRLRYKYQSKIGYDTLIQKFNPKEMINIMSATITDLDIVLKIKNRRNKYLKS